MQIIKVIPKIILKLIIIHSYKYKYAIHIKLGYIHTNIPYI